VGQHKDSLAFMAGTNAGRRKHTPLCIPPHLGQLAEYPSYRGFAISFSIGHHESVDVFEEEPSRLNLPKDSSRVRPQVALVVGEQPLPGEAVALARDSRNHKIHDSTPRLAVKGSYVCPHRARIHASVLHRLRQYRAREGFPLDHAHRSSASAQSSKSDVDAGVEPTAAGAE
jgi:hypothetical protein